MFLDRSIGKDLPYDVFFWIPPLRSNFLFVCELNKIRILFLSCTYGFFVQSGLNNS